MKWVGELGIILFTECPKSPTRKRYQSVNVLTGIAPFLSQIQVQQLTNPCADHAMLIKPLPVVTVMPLVMRTLRRMVMGHNYVEMVQK